MFIIACPPDATRFSLLIFESQYSKISQVNTGTNRNKQNRADTQAKNVYLVGQSGKGRNLRPNSTSFVFWTYPKIEGLFWTVEVSMNRGGCYTCNIARRREDSNGKQNLLLRPCIQPGPKPRPSNRRLPAVGRTGPRHRDR